MNIPAELRKGVVFSCVRDKAADLIETQAERIAELEVLVRDAMDDGPCRWCELTEGHAPNCNGVAALAKLEES